METVGRNAVVRQAQPEGAAAESGADVMRQEEAEHTGPVLRKITPTFIVNEWAEDWWARSPLGSVCTLAEMLGVLEREGKLVVCVEERDDAARR